jgi:hypothetical protein
MASAQVRLPDPCVAPDERTVAALAAHAEFAQTMRRFSEALEDQVFCQHISEDRKTVRSYQKSLLKTDAYLVLQTIWKESDLITPGELRAAGLARTFEPRSLTCHRLGVRFAACKEDVAASNTRIKTIATAAEAYGLITREIGTGRQRPLIGTPLLHGIMVDISQPLTLPSDVAAPAMPGRVTA